MVKNIGIVIMYLLVSDETSFLAETEAEIPTSIPVSSRTKTEIHVNNTTMYTEVYFKHVFAHTYKV